MIEKGIITSIDIKKLAQSEHILTIKLATNTLPTSNFAYIPFWKQEGK